MNEDIFLKKIISKLGKENLLQGNEDAVALDLISEDNLSSIMVINTDSMAWSSDALPPDISFKDFSKKLVTMAVSDVIAKGATPKYFMSTISTPKDISETKLDEIFEGMKENCEKYNLSYLGGDLGSTKELVLTGIVIGFATPKSLLKRSNAKENDLICTTGYFGLTGLGYKLYLGKEMIFSLNTGLADSMNEKLKSPIARIDWLPFLKKYANSSIDSSDGLLKSLQHIANESKVEITIDELPISPEILKSKPSVDEKQKVKPTSNKKRKNNLFSDEMIINYVLYGGEEFEIIFTINERNYELLIEELSKTEVIPPIVIGRIKNGSPNVKYNNRTIPIKKKRMWDAISGFQD